MRPTSRSCTRTLLGLAFAAAAFSPFAAFAQNSDYERRIRPAASPTETLLASFTGTANGSTPMSSLVKSSSGLYYGVTSVGGTTNQGTLFCMTTAGVITNQYTDPTPNSGPDVIVTGTGDGDLWFTEQFGTKIAQMTTAGVITEYPVPTPSSQPGGLTVGTDDALWFTEHTGNQIGRLTLAGEITEYPVPTPASDPMVIEPGPDGALWFTEFYGNKIGRITTPE